MSDRPTCRATASHIAASSIHPYPLSAHVPEVTMGYTLVCRPGIVLHELLEASQNSPVVLASHVTVPQTQAPGLAAVPFVIEQEGNLLHRPMAASQ